MGLFIPSARPDLDAMRAVFAAEVARAKAGTGVAAAGNSAAVGFADTTGIAFSAYMTLVAEGKYIIPGKAIFGDPPEWRQVDTDVRSIIFNASSSASVVRIVALWEPQDASTVGVDTKFFVTANGAQWAEVNLKDLGVSNGNASFVGGVVSVTPGTALQWKWKTYNLKVQRLHGVWMQWV